MRITTAPTTSDHRGPLEVVAFDLDGTLVDTMRRAPGVYAETIRRLGGPRLQDEDITRVWHMGPTEVLLGHFLERAATAEDLETYFRAFRSAFGGVRAFPGVQAMLDELHDRGLRPGVYTTASRRAAAILLETSGLGAHVDAVVAGDEVTRPKPHPEGLERLCQALGASAGAAFYVGDAALDLACATAAGSVPVFAAWGGAPMPVPAPRTIARTPGEVVGLAVAARARHGGWRGRRPPAAPG